MRMELNWPMEPLMCLGVISPKYMGSTLRAIPVRRRKAFKEASENTLALPTNRLWLKFVPFDFVLSAEKTEQMSPAHS